MKKPYLIQRGKITARSKSSPIRENVKWDYMGSAEFEWGALPTSLRRIFSNFDKYRRFKINVITDLDSKPLVLVHPFETETDLNQYVEYIQMIIDNKLNLKERIDIQAHIVIQDKWDEKRRRDTDIWWDIENDCWFSFDNLFMKHLPYMWKESEKLMNKKD